MELNKTNKNYFGIKNIRTIVYVEMKKGFLDLITTPVFAPNFLFPP